MGATKIAFLQSRDNVVANVLGCVNRFAYVVFRFLISKFVILFFGVCVNRSVLLNLGPLWSCLSSRHECRHVHASHVDSCEKGDSQCWCAVATESVCVVFRCGVYVNKLFALSHCFFLHWGGWSSRQACKDAPAICIYVWCELTPLFSFLSWIMETPVRATECVPPGWLWSRVIAMWSPHWLFVVRMPSPAVFDVVPCGFPFWWVRVLIPVSAFLAVA